MPNHRDVRWRRIQETFSALDSRPVLGNLFQICGRLFWLLLRVERRLKRFLPRKQPVFPDTLAGLDLSRGMRVLIIAEDRIPQCWRYRVLQKITQLATVDVEADAVAWTDAVFHPEVARYYHIVIFYRVPGYEHVLELIADIRASGKLVFYETDDIIFDAEIQREVIESSHRQISRKLQKQVLNGADYYRKALLACSYGIASTSSLAEQLERWMGKGKVIVHRNGTDDLSRLPDSGCSGVSGRVPESIRLFYGSGTRTHDADLAMIAPALAEVMQKYSQVSLILVGYISVPEPLRPYMSRIDQLPILDAENYMQVLHDADINLAPLVPGVFADSKSEIKWLEAAVLGVSSVVSASQSFAESVADGATGMLAATHEQWVSGLSELIESEQVRTAIGQAAKQAAWVKYQPRDLGKQLKLKLLDIARSEGAETQQDRMAVVFLGKHGYFSQRWEVENHDQFKIYQPDLSVEQVLGSFQEYLNFIRPDLVVIGRIIPKGLADTLKENRQAFLVLLQDASWLAGQEGSESRSELGTMNSVIISKYVTDLNAALGHRRMLSDLCHSAAAVVCASDELAQIYEAAGFDCETNSIQSFASLVNSSKNPD